MTTVHCIPGSVVVLELLNVKPLRQRCPDLYGAVIECAVFVNWRRLEKEQPAGAQLLGLEVWSRRSGRVGHSVISTAQRQTSV
jgi:hypothetical protein